GVELCPGACKIAARVGATSTMVTGGAMGWVGINPRNKAITASRMLVTRHNQILPCAFALRPLGACSSGELALATCVVVAGGWLSGGLATCVSAAGCLRSVDGGGGVGVAAGTTGAGAATAVPAGLRAAGCR